MALRTLYIMRANTSEDVGTIFVKPTTTGETIKLLVQTLLGKPEPTLRCISRQGRLIQDADTVEDHEIADGSTVMIIDPKAEAEAASLSEPASRRSSRRNSQSRRRSRRHH